ncbi:unnamed protein product [Didymodactylos carnosus]|uniref:RING-type domain-containing protein n=1 Tax=Didymodactylos carnosus TaxID=1234261 RepID=A0A815EP91_9BILA|nr:unnamed protein product [Didymodactylos carnosus]CAF4145209.1 unnamed protein product [Didymodactylos carnosus]
MSDLQCTLCHRILTDPYFIACGHSFDRQCIEDYRRLPREEQSFKCPTCKTVVNPHLLTKNYQLANVLQTLERTTLTPATTNDAIIIHEMYLLDISHSMWWSDWTSFPFFGLIGPSRFNIARRVLRELFEKRQPSPVHKVAFLVFDSYARSAPNTQNFSTITQQHFDELNKLEPIGKKTAVYDAIMHCLRLAPANSQYTSLTILTDGDDNLSNPINRTHVARQNEDFIIKKSNGLHIKGRVIHIGNQNIDNTKYLSDRLGYEFHHAHSGNVTAFTQGFIQTTDNNDTRLATITANLNELSRQQPTASVTTTSTVTATVPTRTPLRPLVATEDILLQELLATSPDVPRSTSRINDSHQTFRQLAD